MTMSSTDALEAVYGSLDRDNEDIDLHIANLKTAMTNEKLKEISVNPDRLAQNNRQGRKMMQSYFKRRGVKVVFKG